MKQLLVICGPTATGKTGLAIQLAKKFRGELVSADSRQVYVGMDIGTGKDLPRNVKCQMSLRVGPPVRRTSRFGEDPQGSETNIKRNRKNICFYDVNGIKLWGYDLVKPTEGFSVGQYIKIARKIIEDIWKRGKLPIIVGGAGLYIKGVVDGIPTSYIPQNVSLRKSLEKKTANQLYEVLAQLDPVKAATMNISDKKNPRRIIRAIEIAQWKLEERKLNQEVGVGNEADVLFIGLSLSKRKLGKRIERRVEKRIKMGLEFEIKKLIDSGVNWEMQAMATLGYKEWREYFADKSTKEKVITKWKTSEKKYAKKQVTWFKRDKRIVWFDAASKKLKKSVENMVLKWYSSKSDTNMLTTHELSE